ncbi:MAG: alpha/beta fold hydrolase [Solirubrobacterales bacterium]
MANEGAIETGTVEVDGIATFFRRLPGEGPPAVFVHGNPTHSADWLPILERIRGPALALDLPGFGRSERPDPARFDYGFHRYALFLDRFLDELGVGGHSLVAHDWGGLALIAAQRRPERVRRLVLTNCVPLLPGYRWHRLARTWRTRGLGEISNRLWTRRLLALGLREARGDWSPFPPEFVDMIWDHLDAGTFGAILRLYRSADESALARAGEGLGRIEAPALVIWSGRDRYLPARFGRAYADALGNAELIELPRAGHWSWRDEPGVVERIASFLEGGTAAASA